MVAIATVEKKFFHENVCYNILEKVTKFENITRIIKKVI